MPQLLDYLGVDSLLDALSYMNVGGLNGPRNSGVSTKHLVA